MKLDDRLSPDVNFLSPSSSSPAFGERGHFENLKALDQGALSMGSVDTTVPGVFSSAHISQLQDITDGASNTIFMCEVRAQCRAEVNNGWEATANGCGGTSTIIPINYDSWTATASPGGQSCHLWCNWVTVTGSKSPDTDGAHFLFGDGRVNFLSESIDHRRYQLLGAKADGRPAQLPD